MANFESTKEAVRAAEECAMWARNAAQTIASVCPEDCCAPSWLYFHERSVEQLCDAIDAVVSALHREAA
jgi:hypothetical protein